ncbi:hypothetical protein [Neorhodopirellula pilleata]|uniref:Tetratricopeptide repeat protein n=1 Tax=Neorhodopirellula pilleata TaxID=2714738 RepID=A0A5C6ADL9_9BACT|nr:hypothetical protein [Neorhodopirellula pilleata]TWT97507.1 hypothetical protein Pla100_26610 [Neorhodopirellula pilleata]
MNQRFVFLTLFITCLVTASSICRAQSPTEKDKKDAASRQLKEKNAGNEQESLPPTFASYREAISAGYEHKNAGNLKASRDAYEAALGFESTDRQKCDAYRQLISIYSELGQWESMYKATEYIVENPPYPAYSSLSVRAMIGYVYRKKMQEELFARYEARLEENPKDRTTLIILEKAVEQLKHDLPRRADYLRRMIELDVAEGVTPDPEMRAQLAFTLRLSHKEIESAEMYEAIANSDENYRSFGLAQAAESWQRAGESKKSIDAAVKASNLGPDVRASRSLYEWHRLLGDLFLKHLAKEPAKKHYAAALEHATIDPYRDQCREQLKLVEALRD